MFEVPDEKPVTPITPCTKEIITSLLSTDNISLVGLNSGVPTRTTATLTPTMLRNIDQTCIEIQCQVESHQNQAGFVPPIVPSNQGFFVSVVDTKRWQGGSTRISEPRPPSSVVIPNKCSSTPPQKRNAGGRKPNKDIDISPEEEERRAVRRERNKMAAARCRKRRLDHTNELIEETEELEVKKQSLQLEIQQLQMQKEELELILESHKPCCRINPPNSPPDIKPYINEEGDAVPTVTVNLETICKKPSNISILKGSHNPINRSTFGGSKRPDSLPVFPGSVNTADGIPITTPTNGIPFNFESLMEGGTGLTPVSGPLIPSCSTQQRNSDLSSPDSNKLVSL